MSEANARRRTLTAQLRGPGAEKLIEAMPEPAILVDAEARVMLANPPARALLPALKIGEALVLALRAPDVTDAIRRVAAGAQAEQALWSERVPIERLFQVDIAPLAAEADEVVAMLLTLRDLTEARRVERMRADFIANASHELRTPLASLLGFVETLQGPAQGDAKARDKFLAIMGEQGRRMARLIDDLLSLSRIEQKQHLRPAAEVDWAQVVRHVADTLAPLARELGVELKLDAERPVVVVGERDELVQVAENLIENAIKYGAHPDPAVTSKVEIAVASRGKDGVLVVADHGRGVAPEHLPRLTERFYRVDPGQSRAKNGTGLGLAIVKHILTRHRGRLAIESRLGAGATFTASVPLAKPQEKRTGTTKT
ncbi:MAG TPA: ATP-binding protein [Roseiarcus sp.]|nr:ATP-binding protein [Roseiarcus sp.]